MTALRPRATAGSLALGALVLPLVGATSALAVAHPHDHAAPAPARPVTVAVHRTAARTQLHWKDALPQFRGGGHVGDHMRLTHAPRSGFSPRATRLTYQWLRDGEPIAGAHGVDYILRPADHVQRIAVLVRGYRAGYRSGTVKSVVLKVAR